MVIAQVIQKDKDLQSSIACSKKFAWLNHLPFARQMHIVVLQWSYRGTVGDICRTNHIVIWYVYSVWGVFSNRWGIFSNNVNSQFSALRSVLCALIKFANQKMTRVFHNADRVECQICHLPVSYDILYFPPFIQCQSHLALPLLHSHNVNASPCSQLKCAHSQSGNV